LLVLTFVALGTEALELLLGDSCLPKCGALEVCNDSYEAAVEEERALAFTFPTDCKVKPQSSFISESSLPFSFQASSLHPLLPSALLLLTAHQQR